MSIARMLALLTIVALGPALARAQDASLDETAPGAGVDVADLQVAAPPGAAVDLSVAPPKELSPDIEVVVVLAADDLTDYVVAVREGTARLTMEKARAALRESQDELLAAIEEIGRSRVAPDFKVGEPRLRLEKLINAVVLTLPRMMLADVQALPQVTRVEATTRLVPVLADTVPLVGADLGRFPVGSRGRGVTIAVLDTGIDVSNGDFGDCAAPGPRPCRVTVTYNAPSPTSTPCSPEPSPGDRHGHGTHVAGIAAAGGGPSRLQGMASDATLYDVRVFDCGASGLCFGDWADVAEGLEFAADPDCDGVLEPGEPDILNLSIGGGDGDPASAMSIMMDNISMRGILVVVAAGNDGPGDYTVDLPGGAKTCLTVGATTKFDTLWSSSSRGPLAYGNLKPEIVAPGVDVCSVVPLVNAFPPVRCVSPNPVDSLHVLGTGTSMAAPHVSGAAALVLQSHPWPDLSTRAEMLKGRLVHQAQQLAGLPVTWQGNGRLDMRLDAFPLSAFPPVVNYIVNNCAGDWRDNQQQIVVRNVSAVSQLVQPSLTFAGIPGRVTMTVSGLTPFTLAPGASRSFPLDAFVSQLQPVPGFAPFGYSGTLSFGVGSLTNAIRVPFYMNHQQSVQATFALGAVDWIWMHDRTTGLYEYYFLQSFGTLPSPWQIIPPPPPGVYDVWVGGYLTPNRVVAVKEGVVIGASCPTTIAFDLAAECTRPYRQLLTGPSGAPVPGGTWISRIKHLPSGRFVFPIAGRGLWSAISDDYEFQQVAMGQPARGTLHVYNDRWLGTGLRDLVVGSAGWACSETSTRTEDFPASQPYVHLGIDTDPYARYWTSTNLVLDLDQTTTFETCMTPLIDPQSDMRVQLRNGNLWPFSEDTSPLLYANDTSAILGHVQGTPRSDVRWRSTDHPLTVGVGPDFWFGRFSNTPSQIRIDSATRTLNHFFVEPDLGYRFAGPRSYRLCRGASCRTGFFATDETVRFPALEVLAPIPGAGPHVLTVTAPHEILATPGSTTVTATFDASAPDPDPPYLTKVAYLSNGEISELIASACGGEMQLEVQDATRVTIEVRPTSGGPWSIIPFTGTLPQLVADLSSLPVPDGNVDVRITATDLANNSIVHEQVPAFNYRSSFNGPGTETNVNPVALGDQITSSVAVLPDGRFAVTYETLPPFSADRVLVQVFAADGSRLGAPVDVTGAQPGEKRFVDIAAAGGEFVVAWAVDTARPTGSVWMRRLDRDANLLGPATQVNDVPGYCLFVHVAGDEDGQTCVVWTWSDVSWAGREVHGKLFDASGAVIPLVSSDPNDHVTAAQFRATAPNAKVGACNVSLWPGNDPNYAALAITWDDVLNVYGRTWVYWDPVNWTNPRFIPDLPAFQVSEFPGRPPLPGETPYKSAGDVAVHLGPGLTFTWASMAQDEPGVNLEGVFGKTYTWNIGSGSFPSWVFPVMPPPGTQRSGMGSEYQVNDFVLSHQSSPRLSITPDDELVFAWQTQGPAGACGKRYDATLAPIPPPCGTQGAGLGYEFQIPVDTSGFETSVAIAHDPVDGDLVATWSSWTLTPRRGDVRARRWDDYGFSLIWP